MEAIRRAAGSNPDCKTVITTADTFYDQRKQRIRELQSLALLDGLVPSMSSRRATAPPLPMWGAGWKMPPLPSG